MRLYRKHAVIILGVKHIKQSSPVNLIESCGGIIISAAVNLDNTLEVNVINSVAPVSELLEIIVSPADAVRSVILDAEPGQCVVNNAPRLVVINEVCPVAVIGRELYVSCLRVVEQD